MKIAHAEVIAYVLAVSLLVLPADLGAKEKRGATVVVTKLDGAQVSGELIAVKAESLLLLSAVGRDESIDKAEIKSVRVVRRSQAGLYASIGGAAGAVAGATVGAYIFNSGSDDQPAGLGSGLAFGALGVLVGLLANTVLTRDSRFEVAEGKPESVAAYWKKLRPYSREGRLVKR